MSARNLLMGGAGTGEKQYVDDVFSTYLYTGNGVGQAIVNGIALGDGLALKAGDAFGGGFYAGQIKGDGVSYALIVAPKASGEAASLAVKTSNDSTTGTTSTWNGAANTAAMIAAGAAAHPAANFCKGLSIGGYTDWVLPAKDQLELLYRQLKPDATANSTSYGANPSSDPVGANYTAGSPAQTAIAAFKAGGSEAFEVPSYYCTSTENAGSPQNTWIQMFSSGGQTFNGKANAYRVRAVRMIPLSDPLLDKYRIKGDGGLTIIKSRSSNSDWSWNDTVRGVTNDLSSTSAAAQTVQAQGLNSFQANGFNIGSFSKVNSSGTDYASWTFKKAAKFFDVVTYTGNGADTQNIPHNLGTTPGMVMVKAASSTGDWVVWHRAFTGADHILLNSTAAKVTTGAPARIAADASKLIVHQGGAPYSENATGVTYVAYLFAHDDSADGMVQCGSVTYTASGIKANVELGWEPQFVMFKRTTGTGDWWMMDTMRGNTTVGGVAVALWANNSNVESSYSSYGNTHATGFTLPTNLNGGTDTFVYMAIRRPNKPPTVGTDVYNAIARTGTGAAATVTGVGFAPDLILTKGRSALDANTYDRLRGPNKELNPSTTGSENSRTSTVTAFTMSGFSVGSDESSGVNANSYRYAHWNFRRAPGFMDVVCYTGDGVAGERRIPHGLKAKPELTLVKSRKGAQDWQVSTTNKGLLLNSGAASVGSGFGGYITEDYITPIGVGVNGGVNGANVTYIAYLFATLPGISKVGSYTGNGATQTIPCGFTTGARFLLVKRTDAVGDWFIWDTARGIVAANDPHLSLNTAVAEVTTDDSVDPDVTGFIVNQVAATNINVTGSTYIFLAIS